MEKNVNSFCEAYKQKLYLEKQTKLWNQRRKRILDKKSAGSSSRLRTDYNLAYKRDYVMRTLEEKVEEFDTNPEMHYYAYFSTSRYQYRVNVIHFKSISDIKCKYYGALTYYDTYAEANAEADRMNKEDTDIKHLICRAIKVFDDSLFEITDKYGSQLNSLGRYSVSVLRNICQFVQNVMTVEEKKD